MDDVPKDRGRAGLDSFEIIVFDRGKEVGQVRTRTQLFSRRRQSKVNPRLQKANLPDRLGESGCSPLSW